MPDTMVTSTGTYRVISDHQGSVRLVVNDTTGAVAERIDYDEWGNVTADTSPGVQPFGFAGGLYDKDTGLVWFGARDYDASVRRWTSKDPVRFIGSRVNLYGYVVNDPIDWTDSPASSIRQCVLDCLNGVWNSSTSAAPLIVEKPSDEAVAMIQEVSRQRHMFQGLVRRLGDAAFVEVVDGGARVRQNYGRMCRD